MKFAELIIKVIDTFYIKPISSIVPRQTYRYAVCGSANMILDILLYFIVYNFIFNKELVDLGVAVISPHIAAMVIVFPVTFFNGFWLNKNVAFSLSPIKTRTQLMRYLISVAGALLLNYVCLKMFVELFDFWATPSKALTTLISVVYSYLMAKLFTFRGAKE